MKNLTVDITLIMNSKFEKKTFYSVSMLKFEDYLCMYYEWSFKKFKIQRNFKWGLLNSNFKKEKSVFCCLK
jgi:hypothetical protein